ncbi:MAG: hypothetical protein RI907_483 [Pseudomonadota bacterium]|jgi:mono/diheme cytochrome c family protein
MNPARIDRWRWRLGTLALVAGVWAHGRPAHAEVPPAPIVDVSQLPAVPQGWAEPNPLRGQAEAIRVGRDAFNQACARCHGMDANGSRAPAPDLRRLGGACAKVSDEALRARCQADADFFFAKSVRLGKKKFDIEHMPAWEPVLSPQLAWAIRTFIENAPKGNATPSVAELARQAAAVR